MPTTTAKYTYGLDSVMAGEAAPGGTMPTTLTKLGEVYKGTCQFNQDDPEVTDHYEEGVAIPKVSEHQGTVPYITLQLMDPSAAVLASVFGGTASGDVWGISGTEARVTKAIKLVTKVGLDFVIPNALIIAKMSGTVGSGNLVLVDITIRPQAVTSGNAFGTVAKV